MSRPSSRMLIGRYISENLKKGARKARACNIARWFVINYPSLEGNYISSRRIRKEIPSEVKNLGLNLRSDLKAHTDALNHLGLSWIEKDGNRMVDMSLINLKRATSFLLGSRETGAIYINEPSSPNEDLKLISSLDQICGTGTIVFKDLTENAQAFVENLTVNYPEKIKAGSRLSNRQRKWALDLISYNQ